LLHTWVDKNMTLLIASSYFSVSQKR